MSRRKQSGDVNIGSDSFLDVIANIVGILIILIVIAGIRVSRAPVITVSTKSPDEKTDQGAPEFSIAESTGEVNGPEIPSPQLNLDPPETPSQSSDLADDTADTPVSVTFTDEPDEPLEDAFVETLNPPVDLSDRMRMTREELESLSNTLRNEASLLRELEDKQAKGLLRLTTVRTELQQLQSSEESGQLAADDEWTRVKTQQSNLDLLNSQIKNAENLPVKVKALKHRVTPVSQVVVGDQIHFRLSQNRVSLVPMDDLLAAAMRQAQKHGDDLAQSRIRIGTVGPIGGYMMQYKLQAVPASIAERARFGPGIVRIALTSFQIEPDTNLIEDTPERALSKGSSFDTAIQTAERGTTFTLWVYPDSFPLYRQLRDRLHESGITVAGRPIPKGIPIAGSPDGTASEGQ